MSKICLLKSTFDSRHVSLGNRSIGTGAREGKHRQKQEDSAVRRVLTASGTSRRVEMKFDDGIMLHISCCGVYRRFSHCRRRAELREP